MLYNKNFNLDPLSDRVSLHSSDCPRTHFVDRLALNSACLSLQSADD